MKNKLVGVLVAVAVASLCVGGIKLHILSKADNAKANISNQMSTKELLEKVLDNEELDSIVFYNSIDDVLDVAVDSLDGLEELINRDDCIDTVIDMYNEYDLADSYATDAAVFSQLDNSGDNLNDTVDNLLQDESICENADKDMEEAARVFFLEELLTSKEVLDNADNEDIEQLQQVSLDKYEEKKESEFHKDNADNVYERAIEKETDSYYNVSVSDDKITNQEKVEEEQEVEKEYNTTVKTPKGSTVEVTVSPYFGDEKANLLNMKTKFDFPGVMLLASSDNRYNCHSYAWHQSDVNNKYWMHSPIPYIIDGSYDKVDDVKVGDKVGWFFYQMKKPEDVEHSAIVEIVEEDGIVVISKWGQGPLVRHYVKYSPYRNPIYYYRSAS